MIFREALREVLQALEKSAGSKNVFQELWVPEYVDMIFRTAGEMLISNFLPLQSGEAKIVLFEKLYNEVTISDIEHFLQH